MLLKGWLYLLIPIILFFALLGLIIHIYGKSRSKKMESAKFKMLDDSDEEGV